MSEIDILKKFYQEIERLLFESQYEHGNLSNKSVVLRAINEFKEKEELYNLKNQPGNQDAKL